MEQKDIIDIFEVSLIALVCPFLVPAIIEAKEKERA